MRDELRVSLVQMTSTDRHAGNIAAMRTAVARAADEGAELVAMPEVAGLMNRDRASADATIVAAGDDPFLAACREAARAHRLWLQPGSTPVRGPAGRHRNHAVLIDPTGAIVARYDKIHLFDVFLDGRPPTGESERFAPGDTAVLVETPWGGLGHTICYDLRFPGLFRTLAQAGARVLLVPAAFTVPTGSAHWETLLRARAIETGAWLVAAAQVGHHDDGRETWGHSLVVSTWGEVLADLGRDGPAQTTLALDLSRVEAARSQIPSLRHDRPYRLERIDAREGAPA